MWKIYIIIVILLIAKLPYHLTRYPTTLLKYLTLLHTLLFSVQRSERGAARVTLRRN